MPAGSQVTLSGVVKHRNGRLELANPDILAISGDGEPAKSAPAILARYPEVAGVPPARLRAACQAACARVGAAADDGVPATVEARRAAAVARATRSRALHSPAGRTSRPTSSRR